MCFSGFTYLHKIDKLTLKTDEIYLPLFQLISNFSKFLISDSKWWKDRLIQSDEIKFNVNMSNSAINSSSAYIFKVYLGGYTKFPKQVRVSLSFISFLTSISF